VIAPSNKKEKDKDYGPHLWRLTFDLSGPPPQIVCTRAEMFATAWLWNCASLRSYPCALTSQATGTPHEPRSGNLTLRVHVRRPVKLAKMQTFYRALTPVI